MRFGLFLQPVHHPSESPTAALEDDLALVEHLDRLGYDEVWVGEHHSTGWENVAAPEAFIAAAAERTRHIEFGTGIIQLGLHNPLIALNRMIFLDHLTRGRVSFGVGVGGGLPSDLHVFGISREEAGKRLHESMDVMLRLLESPEPISEKTDWFELHNATLPIAPYTKPHMPFAAASSNPKTLELMGQIGGKVLTGPIPDKVEEMFGHLQRGAEAVGRQASRRQIMLSYEMHLSDSIDTSLREVRAGLIRENSEFSVGVNNPTAEVIDPDELVERWAKRAFVGTPEDARAKLERIDAESGGFGGIIFTARDWAGTEASHRSWELFARHVAPTFTGDVEAQARAARAATELNQRHAPS